MKINWLHKFLSKIFSYNLLMDILYEKLSQKHNLRENDNCPLCKSYFELDNRIQEYKSNN